MNASVIIPSYESQEILPDTLDALLAQTAADRMEVIVVDCSDTDAVEKICADKGVRCQGEAKRFNPGTGRNIGAELATGDLLIFVDADVLLAADAVHEALTAYEHGHKAFGGALEVNVAKSIGVATYVEHYFFNHESQKGRPAQQRSNLSSAFSAFDRELFLDAGGFTNIPRMQDTEFTERLARAGQELRYVPSMVGYQIQDSPLPKVFGKVKVNGENLYAIRYADQPASKRVMLGVALPAITFAKVGRIIARHLRWQDADGRKMTVRVAPHLFAAGGYWMSGFYKSMLKGGTINAGRD